MEEARESCTQSECETEFDRLFPDGFFGPDVRGEIAFEKIIDTSDNDLDKTEQDVCELVGRCVWDVFSDQHKVIAADERLIHLGSFRGTGEFIAEWLNRRIGRRRYDYMSFYLGTGAPWTQEHGDLTPIFEMIFRRLMRRGLDWVYHFPRIYLVDFRPLRDAMNRQGKQDWEGYSPSEALAKEIEDRKRDEEIAAFREQLDAGRNDAIDAALTLPPPPRVEAYRTVYGHWPSGWPPAAADGN